MSGFSIEDYLKQKSKEMHKEEIKPVEGEVEQPVQEDNELKFGFSDHPYPKCWSGCDCC